MWSQSTETPDEVEFTDTFRQSETVEKKIQIVEHGIYGL